MYLFTFKFHDELFSLPEEVTKEKNSFYYKILIYFLYLYM